MNFGAVKNRFLNLRAVLNFATTQNEPNQAKKLGNPQPVTKIHNQFFLTISKTKQILTITLLTEEALLIWVLQR